MLAIELCLSCTNPPICLFGSEHCGFSLQFCHTDLGEFFSGVVVWRSFKWGGDLTLTDLASPDWNKDTSRKSMCAIAVKMKTFFPKIVIACSYFLILMYTSNIIPLPQTVSLVPVYSFISISIQAWLFCFIFYLFFFLTKIIFYVEIMIVMKICICLIIPVVCTHCGIHYHGVWTLVYISIRFPYYCQMVAYTEKSVHCTNSFTQNKCYWIANALELHLLH